jgi:hypothetical protein
LFVRDLYREAPWAVAAFRGNDLVTVALVTPLLVTALVQSARTCSSEWPLVWLGAVWYSVYNFAYYAFGARFNDVFLLHVATLSLSILTLVCLGVSLDVSRMAARVADGTAPRVIGAAYLIVLWVVVGFQANAGIEGKAWASLPVIVSAGVCFASTIVLLARRERRPAGKATAPGRLDVTPA